MPTMTTPVTYTIEGAKHASGLGSTKLYELIGKGVLEGRKAGRRTLVTAESLHAYLASLPKLTSKKAA